VSTLHTPAVPAPVRLSVRLWLGAIAAGAAEALVWLVQPEPPTPTQLGVRFAIYTALVVLVLALHTGRAPVRWAVAGLLGGIGSLSLVIEPLTWLGAGGSPAAFLAAADAPTLMIVILRVLHIAAVVGAMVALFRPEANAFYRGARC
jgi:hypothetical protein